MTKYMIKRYHSRRQAALEQLGNACVVCGCTTDLAISTKVKGKNFTRIFSLSLARFNEELKNFELRCQVHKNKKRFKHFTYTAYYRHGCRCELCEEWHADYCLQRQENRRRAQDNAQAAASSPSGG